MFILLGPGIHMLVEIKGEDPPKSVTEVNIGNRMINPGRFLLTRKGYKTWDDQLYPFYTYKRVANLSVGEKLLRSAALNC